MISLQPITSSKDSLCWYTTSSLPVPHGMLLRHGGCSRGVFSSLNLSFGTGDNPDDVRDNRQRIKKKLGIRLLASAVQVHGTDIVKVERITVDTEFPEADALISDQPGVGLMIQQADCQAILFYDPVQGVIGAAHSGWRGSVKNIAARTISAMQNEYGVSAANIRTVISPSLGPCCAEFINASAELPPAFFKHQVRPNYFDFWEISRQQLQEAGIKKENIEITKKCTACNRDFFSYRRSVKNGEPETGRNGSFIFLPLLARK